MLATEVVQHFFHAWNRHDLHDIQDYFAENGTYKDPGSEVPLTGEAIFRACESFFAAFSDISLEITDLIYAGGSNVAVQWCMCGTNTGSFRGRAPTGNKISLAGADFLVVEHNKIFVMQRYYEQQDLFKQLGLQIVVQPYATEALRFGTSVQLQSDKRTRPQALSVTWIDAASPEGLQTVNEHGWLILEKMKRMPGFIGYTNMTIGQRQYTISAWEDLESPHLLLNDRQHAKAVKQFYTTDIATAGHTSVWKPYRSNPLWVKCTSCGSMIDYEQRKGVCRCNAALPDPPPYW